MDIQRPFWKSEGTGNGQFLEISDKTNRAVIKVDAATYHQLEKCCDRRPLGMFSQKIGDEAHSFFITVNLAFESIPHQSLSMLYGTIVNFHWALEKARIVVTQVEDACYSTWCHYDPFLDEGASDSDESESESEEDRVRYKFFQDHCLPRQAPIPEHQEASKEAKEEPYIRRRRRVV